jgi:Zn ribbon nucleic-acid-binding protein
MIRCPRCKAYLRFLEESDGPLAECTQCDYTEPRSVVVHQVADSINKEFARYHGNTDPDQ